MANFDTDELAQLRQELQVVRGMEPPPSRQIKMPPLGHPTGNVRPEGQRSIHVGDEVRKNIKRDELMRLLLQGYTIRECAHSIGMTYTTAQRYVKEPEFREKIKEKSAELNQKLEEELFTQKLTFNQRLSEMADAALDEMERLMVESPAEGIRFKASQDILDRDGRAPRTARTTGLHAVVQVDLETLMAAAKAMDEEIGQAGRQGPVASEVTTATENPGQLTTE